MMAAQPVDKPDMALQDQDKAAIAYMRENLGIQRRKNLTQTDDRYRREYKIFADVTPAQLEHERAVNRVGTASSRLANENREQISAWNNLYQTLNEGLDTADQDSDLMSGQSHRARLNSTIRADGGQNYATGERSDVGFGSMTPRRRQGRGGGIVGTRGRGLFSIDENIQPTRPLDPALDPDREYSLKGRRRNKRSSAYTAQENPFQSEQASSSFQRTHRRNQSGASAVDVGTNIIGDRFSGFGVARLPDQENTESPPSRAQPSVAPGTSTVAKQSLWNTNKPRGSEWPLAEPEDFLAFINKGFPQQDYSGQASVKTTKKTTEPSNSKANSRETSVPVFSKQLDSASTVAHQDIKANTSELPDQNIRSELSVSGDPSPRLGASTSSRKRSPRRKESFDSLLSTSILPEQDDSLTDNRRKSIQLGTARRVVTEPIGGIGEAASSTSPSDIKEFRILVGSSGHPAPNSRASQLMKRRESAGSHIVAHSRSIHTLPLQSIPMPESGSKSATEGLPPPIPAIGDMFGVDMPEKQSAFEEGLHDTLASSSNVHGKGLGISTSANVEGSSKYLDTNQLVNEDQVPASTQPAILDAVNDRINAATLVPYHDENANENVVSPVLSTVRMSENYQQRIHGHPERIKIGGLWYILVLDEDQNDESVRLSGLTLRHPMISSHGSSRASTIANPPSFTRQVLDNMELDDMDRGAVAPEETKANNEKEDTLMGGTTESKTSSQTVLEKARIPPSSALMGSKYADSQYVVKLPPRSSTRPADPAHAEQSDTATFPASGTGSGDQSLTKKSTSEVELATKNALTQMKTLSTHKSEQGNSTNEKPILKTVQEPGSKPKFSVSPKNLSKHAFGNASTNNSQALPRRPKVSPRKTNTSKSGKVSGLPDWLVDERKLQENKMLAASEKSDKMDM